jgi:hypothetical protein
MHYFVFSNHIYKLYVHYTEDMYKIMIDTKRQLEDRIGPAVPVCIASGRSPVKIKLFFVKYVNYF